MPCAIAQTHIHLHTNTITQKPFNQTGDKLCENCYSYEHCRKSCYSPCLIFIRTVLYCLLVCGVSRKYRRPDMKGYEMNGLCFGKSWEGLFVLCKELLSEDWIMKAAKLHFPKALQP